MESNIPYRQFFLMLNKNHMNDKFLHNLFYHILTSSISISLLIRSLLEILNYTMPKTQTVISNDMSEDIYMSESEGEIEKVQKILQSSSNER